ncbi:glycosyltransferase [Marinomonas lutimaris]|uniref:glycosyltransferase n=1 Tax=Marinomonas lutimaris TaxID=2846746 RepID=UPI001CA483D8|nr:glycosyltransferase [Marinomonas lutimaris]
MSVKISILMSVYINDSVPFFKEALDSLLIQHEYISQIVLVCDGVVSPEHEFVIKEYEKIFFIHEIDFKNPRLSFNQGLGVALNYGTLFCDFDYIVRMDSDDICAENRLKKLHLLVDENPEIDVIGSQIEEFKRTPGDLGVKRIVPKDRSNIFKYSKLRNPMNHVTACIKLSSLKKVGGYENVLWHEDYFLWVKMLQSGMKFMNVDDVHVHVRVNQIGERRGGIRYLKSELAFLKRVVNIKYFSIFEAIRYMLPRLVVRLLPNKLTTHIYKILRRTN